MKEWWDDWWPVLAWITAGIVVFIGFAWLCIQHDISVCERRAKVMGLPSKYDVAMCFVETDGRWVPIESLRSGMPR